ncbi:GrpB family protein [Chamaesiphon sp. GL140_3_metabinner_50]|uniref:GrpB family protein n=1 Tax=Chamaesiphon sp. GL140_3_metabinner_50 TaxID=2970812 RepID=UPI00345A4EB4
MTRKVIVVPHDRNWQRVFLAESQHLTMALGENMVNIYHIGSTSIPTIYAKPIIDILIEVKDLAKVDERDREIGSLGYVGMGEHGIVGRRFFRKDNAEGLRTHHIHTFETGSPQIDRHLAFRDYLISHPETALEYSELKQQLAQKYPNDIESYMDGKAEFISKIDKKAAQWQSL